MNTFSKKLASIALTATTSLWLSGALYVLPAVPVAHGQSVADLTKQIADLLKLVQALQAQLAAVQGTPSGSYAYTRDLTLGSRGDDVSALQQMLINGGFLTAVSAPTGYFGSLTQAALGKYQASVGISPTAGYFGPKTRAYLSSVGGGPVTPGPGPIIPAPASGLAVSRAADNPAAGSLISSSGSAAARVEVLKVNLTAGTAGGVTVNDLKFTKQGVLSDSSISSAYLIENGKVVGQFSSITSGVINFTGLNLGINAGQTRSLSLAIDPATGLNAGNTVSFTMDMASSIAAVDFNNTAVATSGAFPISGNVFTVTSVSNPSIASVTVSSSSVGTSVYAGTQDVVVSQWTFNPTNNPVWLKGLTFKVVGSASKSDIKNVRLFVNGVQSGPTLPTVSGDGAAHFDLSSSPVKLNTGNSNVQVKADVMGSPSFNFQFEVLNSYDVLAIDTQYNVPVSITVNGGTGVQISILQGSLTVDLATDSPTGNVAKGAASSAFLKFKIYAAGEAVKVKWLTFQLVPTGTLGNTWDVEIKNVSLTDDAGNQIGTTINSLHNAGANPSCTDTAGAFATSTATNCFGNSTSPINYIVPANTTRILTLKGDIQTGAAFSTIQGKLTGNTSNLQGQISSQTASSGSVSGSALTLAANALTVAKNVGLGTQQVSKGANGVKIGSYTLTASSAEGVNLNTITIATSASSTNFQNLKLMSSGSQFGITQTTLSASASYTFSGSLNVPSGQSKTVDVVADVLNSAAAVTYTAVTTLSACSGSGAITGTSISCSNTPGQDLAVAGQPTVVVAAGGTSPDYRVMGSTQVELARFSFTETTNIEDVRITDLKIFQQVAATSGVASGVKSAFQNFNIYKADGSFLASAGAPATAASSSNPGPGYIYTFSGISFVVPKAQSALLVLKADVPSYQSSGATDNTTHVFKVTTSTDTTNDTTGETVAALGNTSQTTTSVTLSSANSNAQTLLRTKVVFSRASLGSASGRAKTS
ncbi:MAG: peptidoglycan-binding protein, partial [Candidatus Liptonbacteria bacterium]|nr:peptidoglycan-binding protein [Candidatus Liptonbacteria bacterium]